MLTPLQISPVEDVGTMIDLFTQVALRDPLSALLLLVGSALVFVSVGAFGYLTLGALVDLLTPEPRSPGPRPPAE